MSGRHGRADEEVDRRRLDPRVRERVLATAGRAMSVSASSRVAMRRSRIPVRSRIHSSEVSTNLARSSFVITCSGTFTPSPVIPMRVVAEPIIRYRSTAKVRVPRAASASPTCAVALPRPIGSADLVDLAGQRQHVAGLHDPLEAAVVDPGEERDLAAILLLDEDGNGACLGHRLDDQHARHHRPAGEVTRKPPGLGTHCVACDNALAGDHLDHLVEEQKRIPVREDRLDHVPTEGHDGVHAATSSSARRMPARPRCA